MKICGLTNIEDALCAVRAGADALGFIFAPSPRRVDLESARGIIKILPPFISKVGVFVNEEPRKIEEISRYVGLDTLQFHGDESPEYCRIFNTFKIIKAFAVREEEDGLWEEVGKYRGSLDAILLDTYVPGKPGGTGELFPWERAFSIKDCGPLILAGGLTPENVRESIRVFSPYGVDVSSGVESEIKGIKDKNKIVEFILNVRRSEDDSR